MSIFNCNFIESKWLEITFRLYLFSCILDVSKRQIHVTALNLDITWRRDRRLPKNPTSSGPLTELPDYTFMDGRPTPMGVCFHTCDSFSLSHSLFPQPMQFFFIKPFPLILQVRMKGRVEAQREIARKIIQGIREVDSAKEWHQHRLQATEEERKSILDSKLKPKGKLLSKKP